MKKQESIFEIEYIQSKPLSKKEREKLSDLILKNKSETQLKNLQ
jgi:ribonuclease HII